MMKAGETNYPKPTTSGMGGKLVRSARAIRTATVEGINPLKASAIVSIVMGGVSAFSNARKYKRGRITKKEALLDTAGESAGAGLATGLGLLASDAVSTSLLIASTSVFLPYTIGFAVAAGTKILWNYGTKGKL
jgi:hypothetical protein